MKISDFNLDNFNSTASMAIAKQSLNFCQAISLSYENNLSVTAKYTPDFYGNKYVSLDENLTPLLSDSHELYYYGVSPKIDSHLIITAISEMRFVNQLGLDQFISDNCAEFMLHENQSEYLIDFARHAVITLAGKYGIRIEFFKELYDLLHTYDPQEEIVKRENEYILLCGCPTSEMCNILNQYRFIRQDNELNKIVFWKVSDKGILFNSIYSDKKNIVLLKGKVFYSGVLIKPLKICIPEDRFENFEMKNICVDFERSTFATVCAFDEVHIYHPLLKDSVKNLSALFYFDDKCKQILSEKLNDHTEYSEEYVWECVNEYLQSSYNVNQIGVSANIITKDKRLLLGLRSSKNIDEGCLYPGVNGNAEIKDDSVSFYSYSVYEDDPTINMENRRIDFVGEIAREAYGEIKLECNNNWTCYGLTLSGQIPEATCRSNIYSEKKRRMHLNIMFEKECEFTQAEILTKKEKATESFETGRLIGLQICCYKNVFEFMFKNFVAFLNNMVNKKEIVESISLILIFCLTLSQNKNTALEWLDYLSYGFAALISVVTLISWTQYLRNKYTFKNMKIKKRISSKKIRIFCWQSYQKNTKKIDRFFNSDFHPAAYAATKLYVENLVYDLIRK